MNEVTDLYQDITTALLTTWTEKTALSKMLDLTWS